METEENMMYSFREITLEDKSLFDSYLRKYPLRISELNFTNLFMWRHYYKYRFDVIEELLCIVVTGGSGAPYAFFPVGVFSGAAMNNRGLKGVASGSAINRIILKLKDYFDSNGWKLLFGRVPHNKLEYFQQGRQFKANVALDRGNSDYVYLSSDLISLEGKRFDGKRNHINKFKRMYEYEYLPLTEDLIRDCMIVEDKWCAARRCQEYLGLLNEKQAIMEALSNFGKLDYTGGVIKVDGMVEAFTIGEKTSDDMAVIHIEKADVSIEGLYTVINQQFCENAWPDITYINREQDLGEPGIRKAKESYNPVMMIDKYTVELRVES